MHETLAFLIDNGFKVHREFESSPNVSHSRANAIKVKNANKINEM
jgi:hypothetical protein